MFPLNSHPSAPASPRGIVAFKRESRRRRYLRHHRILLRMISEQAQKSQVVFEGRRGGELQERGGDVRCRHEGDTHALGGGVAGYAGRLGGKGKDRA